MTRLYGSNSHVGVGVESIWGTPVARTKFQELYGETGGLNPGRVPIETWRARTPVGFIDVGKKAVASVTFPITYDKLHIWLRNAMWDLTSSVVAPDYTHTYKIGTSKPSPLTVEHGNSAAAFAALARIDEGCFVRRMTMEFMSDSISKITFEYVGQTAAFGAVTPATVAATNLFVKPGTFTVTVDAETGEALCLDNASVTLETGLDEGRMCLKGDTFIREPDLTGKTNVSGSFARDWDSTWTGLQTKLGSGGTFILVIKSTGPTLGGSNYSWEVKIPKAVIIGDPVNHSGPGLATETINWQAQDDAADSAMKITVVSSEATP